MHNGSKTLIRSEKNGALTHIQLDAETKMQDLQLYFWASLLILIVGISSHRVKHVFLVSKPMILIKHVACRIVLALRWSLDGLSCIMIFMRELSEKKPFDS